MNENEDEDEDGDYTETCWSCFKAVLLCISWLQNFDDIVYDVSYMLSSGRVDGIEI
jgi:hypothetical protein